MNKDNRLLGEVLGLKFYNLDFGTLNFFPTNSKEITQNCADNCHSAAAPRSAYLGVAGRELALQRGRPLGVGKKKKVATLGFFFCAIKKLMFFFFFSNIGTFESIIFEDRLTKIRCCQSDLSCVG